MRFTTPSLQKPLFTRQFIKLPLLDQLHFSGVTYPDAAIFDALYTPKLRALKLGVYSDPDYPNSWPESFTLFPHIPEYMELYGTLPGATAIPLIIPNLDHLTHLRLGIRWGQKLPQPISSEKTYATKKFEMTQLTSLALYTSLDVCELYFFSTFDVPSLRKLDVRVSVSDDLKGWFDFCERQANILHDVLELTITLFPNSQYPLAFFPKLEELRVVIQERNEKALECLIFGESKGKRKCIGGPGRLERLYVLVENESLGGACSEAISYTRRVVESMKDVGVSLQSAVVCAIDWENVRWSSGYDK